MSSRGIQKLVTDMDEHGKLKGEVRAVIKEALDTLGNKEDRVISAYIKKKCDEKYGPTWHCIVGEDFKAAFSHDSKTFMFVQSGKLNVLLYRFG